MSHTRTPLRPKIRFEVFRRDGFTCQYCGGKPPAVVLEADHVVPVSAGGKNDMANLKTACFECNRGKAARHPDKITVTTTAGEAVLLLLERELQRSAYGAMVAWEAERRQTELDFLRRYWTDVLALDASAFSDVSIYFWLGRIPAESVKAQMDWAAESATRTYSDSWGMTISEDAFLLIKCAIQDMAGLEVG